MHNLILSLVTFAKPNPTEPMHSVTEMLEHLDPVFRMVQDFIPSSGFLIGGSAAFFACFEKEYNRDIVIRDVDVSLIADPGIVEKLYDLSLQHPDVFRQYRTNCRVVSQGYVDVHFDLDVAYNREVFLRSKPASEYALGNPNIRFEQPKDLLKFYKWLNRPKDQEKIQFLKKYLGK